MTHPTKTGGCLSQDTLEENLPKEGSRFSVVTSPTPQHENKDFLTILGNLDYKSALKVLANDLIIVKSGEFPYEKIVGVWFIEGKTPILVYDGYMPMTFCFGLPDNIIIGSKCCSDDGFRVAIFNPKTSDTKISRAKRDQPILKFKLLDESQLLLLYTHYIEVWDFNTLEFKYYLSTDAHDFEILADGNILVNTRRKIIEIWNPKKGLCERNHEFSYMLGDVLSLTTEICVLNYKDSRVEIRTRKDPKRIQLEEYTNYTNIFTMSKKQVFTRDVKGEIRIYDLEAYTVAIKRKGPNIQRGNQLKLIKDDNILICQIDILLLWNFTTDTTTTIFNSEKEIADFGTFQDGRIYVITRGTFSEPPKLSLITSI